MRSPRWQLGVAALFGLLATALAPAQRSTQDAPHGAAQGFTPTTHPAASGAQPGVSTSAPGPGASADAKRGASAAPSHRPQPRLRPLAALQHLQAAAAQAAAATRHRPAPRATAAAERPAGAGRYVAAVVVCADADLDLGATFGVPRADLLVLQTAGGLLDRDDIALLEHFAASERLSLIVLLGHADCTARQVHGKTRAQAGLAARLRALADGVPGEVAPIAQLQRQRDALLGASETLSGLAQDDQLRVVVAQLAADGAIGWHPKAASTLPLAPVK